MTSREELSSQRSVLVDLQKIDGQSRQQASDQLAIEEPLEIRIGFVQEGQPVQRSISVTMRTPGNDFELAAGFLFTEMLMHSRDEITSIVHCGRAGSDEPRNTVRVNLAPSVQVDLDTLQRNFYTTSSCGVCGKSSIEALQMGRRSPPPVSSQRISPEVIRGLSARLRACQATFDSTGGLHAAGLFSMTGELLNAREDVGRHNAVDKIIGAAFLDDRVPLDDHVLMLSGRISFELVQKALVAGIPVIVAIGAPSSLAIETAKVFGITVIGFVREDRFNVYSGQERLSS